MQATPPTSEADGAAGGPAITAQEARREDVYWQRNFWQERYYDIGLEYEDYAPAYCVGYVGCAQYGGEFEDAEKSLWANWERIKGDSRLPFDGALPAMRAAWQRMARLRRQPRLIAIEGGRDRTAAQQPALHLGHLAVVSAAAAVAQEAAPR